MTDNLGNATRTSPYCCRRHALRYGEVPEVELAALPEQCTRGQQKPSPYCPYCGWQECSPRCPTRSRRGELGRIDVGEPIVRLPTSRHVEPSAASTIARRLLITAMLGAGAIAIFIGLVELGVIEVFIR